MKLAVIQKFDNQAGATQVSRTVTISIDTHDGTPPLVVSIDATHFRNGVDIEAEIEHARRAALQQLGNDVPKMQVNRGVSGWQIYSQYELDDLAKSLCAAFYDSPDRAAALFREYPQEDWRRVAKRALGLAGLRAIPPVTFTEIERFELARLHARGHMNRHIWNVFRKCLDIIEAVNEPS